MALELEVSKIKNTVTFQVDKNSLAASKKVVEDFAKMKASLTPVINTVNVKKQIQELQAEFAKLQKQANIPITPKPATVPPRSAPDTSGSPQRPVGRPNHTDEEREARNALKRAGQADVRRSSFGFEAERLRDVLGGDRLSSAGTQADAITEQFRRGTITAQSMNEQLRQQLSILREEARTIRQNNTLQERSARQQLAEEQRLVRQKQRDEERERRATERQNRLLEEQRRLRNSRIGGGLLSGNGGMVAGALGVGAAAMGIGSIFSGLQDTADRNNLLARGADNVQSDPNTLAAITFWGQMNGVDSANIKKQIDNAKDVRERLASSAMSAQLNKKGQWAGGDSGVDQIMNLFGWNPQQLRQFQDRPMDFVQATVNEGQRRGISDAQIGHLLENLGDDMMHYVQLYKNGGEQFKQTMQLLYDTGAYQSNETKENAEAFTRLSFTIDAVKQGFWNNFLNGFMETLNTSGINTKDVFDRVQKSAEWLGTQFADVTNHLGEFASMMGSFVDWLQQTFPSLNIGRHTTSEGGTALTPQDSQEGQTGQRDFQNYLQSSTSIGDGWGELGLTIDRFRNSDWSLSGLDNHQYDFLSNDFNKNAGYQNPLQNLQVTVNPTVTLPDNAFNVSVIPDYNGLTNLFNAQVTSSFQSLTLNANASTTVNN